MLGNWDWDECTHAFTRDYDYPVEYRYQTHHESNSRNSVACERITLHLGNPVGSDFISSTPKAFMFKTSMLPSY